MTKVFEVVYFDETVGGVGSIMVKASSEDRAVDKVERMGEYEVVEVTFVDFYTALGYETED